MVNHGSASGVSRSRTPAWVYLVRGTYQLPTPSSEEVRFRKKFQETGIPVVLFNGRQDGLFEEVAQNLPLFDVEQHGLTITDVKLLGEANLLLESTSQNPFPGESPVAKALTEIKVFQKENKMGPYGKQVLTQLRRILES